MRGPALRRSSKKRVAEGGVNVAESCLKFSRRWEGIGREGGLKTVREEKRWVESTWVKTG